MGLQVSFKMMFLLKRFPTGLTTVWFLSSMDSLMSGQMRRLIKPFTAVAAGVKPRSCIDVCDCA